MYIDISKDSITQARGIANNIVTQMMDYIQAHSTVSIERSVLRLLGVDGIDENYIPWPNRCVDAAQKAGVLANGIYPYLAACAHVYSLDAQQAAEKLSDPNFDWTCLDDKLEAGISHWGEAQVKLAIQRLDQVKSDRLGKQKRLGLAQTPWRYLIVATGSIFEDVPQAVAAAKQGADVIAVIRATAQSLLDFVPYGTTAEGSGGTYATAANFRLLREALDGVSEELGRYVMGTNYASGLCMPEISVLAAQEGLDMLLNDALYGILFRDINLYRTLTDQYFSRMVNGYAGIIINTGEDNYLTTADAIDAGHTVLSSQFINEAFAARAGIPVAQMGLGHAFEIDPRRENAFLDELAMAQLVRQIFPDHPLKYMPPTKHVTGNIFTSYAHQTMYNLATILTNQSICLLGMLTEAIHTPFVHDRYLALQNIRYIANTTKDLVSEFDLKPDGYIATRAKNVLNEALEQLDYINKVGLVQAIGEGCFGDVKRQPDGGKGLGGVFEKGPRYNNPFWAYFESQSNTTGV
jgi:beta-lysine 5,6-aminomutase alpha subunit